MNNHFKKLLSEQSTKSRAAILKEDLKIDLLTLFDNDTYCEIFFRLAYEKLSTINYIMRIYFSVYLLANVLTRND